MAGKQEHDVPKEDSRVHAVRVELAKSVAAGPKNTILIYGTLAAVAVTYITRERKSTLIVLYHI